MRVAIVAVMLLLGCGHGKRPAIDAPPVPDASIDAPFDPDAGSCEPTGLCPEGPACGSGCCGNGEHCQAGVCMCASDPACEGGDICSIGGPGPRFTCGGLCCGVVHGCPI